MKAKKLIALLLLFSVIAAGVYFFYHPLLIALFHLKGYEILETQEFIVLYRPENKASANVVVKAAQKAYYILGSYFSFYPDNKIPIVVFPDRISLQKAFNWPEDENTQGVYYRGTIYVQSPDVWINETEEMDEIFFEKGPIVHEYAHLIIDELSKGNYSRWFTEGAAQYIEREITGYTLKQDFEIENSMSYSYYDIMNRFDELEDEILAYIGALEMVDLLVENGGIFELQKILQELREGVSANEIFLKKQGNLLKKENSCFCRIIL